MVVGSAQRAPKWIATARIRVRAYERPERREAPRRISRLERTYPNTPISPPRSRRTGSADCAQASRLGPASRRGQSYGRDRRRPDYSARGPLQHHSEENDGEPWPKSDHSALNPTTDPQASTSRFDRPHSSSPPRYCANNPAIPLRVRTKPMFAGRSLAGRERALRTFPGQGARRSRPIKRWSARP